MSRAQTVRPEDLSGSRVFMTPPQEPSKWETALNVAKSFARPVGAVIGAGYGGVKGFAAGGWPGAAAGATTGLQAGWDYGRKGEKVIGKVGSVARDVRSAFAPPPPPEEGDVEEVFTPGFKRRRDPAEDVPMYGYRRSYDRPYYRPTRSYTPRYQSYVPYSRYQPYSYYPYY